MRVFIREILVIPEPRLMTEARPLTSNVKVDQQRHVRCCGDLALVKAGVLQAEVPDHQAPVRRAGGVLGLHPQVRGVGVASHR